MLAVYALFIIPLLLFVVAFLYETYLAFARLSNPKAGRSGYVNVTWEITHTLLVFTVVMLLMLFSQSIDKIADKIFIPTFIAATALGIRAVCYIYIFYVRGDKRINWADRVFAWSHIVAAGFLVLAVIEALVFLYQERPTANESFVMPFIPGLVFVTSICLIPIIQLYRSK